MRKAESSVAVDTPTATVMGRSCLRVPKWDTTVLVWSLNCTGNSSHKMSSSTSASVGLVARSWSHCSCEATPAAGDC
jgi:hypothetical protein